MSSGLCADAVWQKGSSNPAQLAFTNVLRDVMLDITGARAGFCQVIS